MHRALLHQKARKATLAPDKNRRLKAIALFNADLVQIATLAFFTGFGSALGTKLASIILNRIEKHAKQAAALMKVHTNHDEQR